MSGRVFVKRVFLVFLCASCLHCGAGIELRKSGSTAALGNNLAGAGVTAGNSNQTVCNIASHPYDTGNGQATTLTGDHVGESFVATASGEISMIRLKGSMFPNPTTVTVAVYEYGGVTPISAPMLGSESLLVTSMLVDTVMDVTFASPIPVVAGNSYWLVVTADTDDDTAWAITVTDTYLAGDLWSVYNGNSWTTITGDLYFVINPC